MEFHLAIKGNELMKFAIKWMDLESITLSEDTQIHKEKITQYFLIYANPNF